jgi:hypothetical protein
VRAPGAAHGELAVTGWKVRAGFICASECRSIAEQILHGGVFRQTATEGPVRQVVEQAGLGVPPPGSALALAVLAAERQVRTLGVSEWSATEITANRYEGPASGISAHRDHVRYVGAVAVLGLHGSARVEILASRTGPVVASWTSSPGDLLVIAGSDAYAGSDPRPFHRVGPPVGGSRLSLCLRCDEAPPARRASCLS